MRFFAPQKIKFDEMSNGLVLDILKFYTAQMKELQERYFKDRNSLVSYEYSDLMSFYDTESLIDLVDIDLEKYKKLKDFGNALRELVAKRAYLYLCKSSLSLQNRLKRFLKSSVPTEEYFVWSPEDYELQVFKNGRIHFLSKQEFLIWLNPKEKIVGVATTSAKKAEGAIALLRAAFTTFPAQLLSPHTMPELVMTEWLKNPLTLPEIFHFGNDTTLKSTDEDGATIKASKEDLTSEEISIHLDSKVVKEISLHYDITADIKLTSDLVIKSFKPVDLYLEKTLPEKSDNPVADAQALLIIEADILASLCPKLLEVFKCKVN